MDTLREIEQRCMAHRFAAEYYSAVDTGLKLTTTVVSAISASASYWAAFNAVPIVSYVLAGTSTIGTILNAVISLKRYDSEASKHTRVAQQLEDVRIQCVAEILKGFASDDLKNAFIQKIKIDISAVLQDAPMLETKFESKAASDLQHRDSKNLAIPASPKIVELKNI